jgi:RES domain-containing protein
LSFENALEKLSRLEPFPLSGTAFRAVNLRYVDSPLSAIGSIRTGGRYNAKGVFEALYLAENPTTTLLEVEFSASSNGKFIAKPKEPYVVFSIHFELKQLIDLAASASLETLGSTRTDLTQSWRLKQLRGEPILTQSIGMKVLELGHEGFKYPSATDNSTNLAVFPKNLKPGSFLEIEMDGRVLARVP